MRRTQNFREGDIVAIECKVISNYIHDDGSLSLKPLNGHSSATIWTPENTLTLIRPVIDKGEVVIYDGMTWNAVAVDADMGAAWISRNDGAINIVVELGEINRMIVGVDHGGVDKSAESLFKLDELPKTTWTGKLYAGVDSDPDQAEEAPPPTPHVFVGSDAHCDECGESIDSPAHAVTVTK